MKKQNGSAGLIALGAVVLVIILAVTAIGIYASYANLGNRSEQNLIAARDNAKNILAQYGQKVLESVQVADMYSEKLKEIVVGAIEGRYGEGGSAAVTQVLTEANINLDPAQFIQVQRLIEAGRNDFQAAQERQIDIRRQYQTDLGTFFGGFVLGVAGYPKIKLSDFDIVSTARTDQAYKTKQEETLSIFNKK